MSIILPLTVKKGQPIRRGDDDIWSVIMEMDQQGQPITLDGIHARCNADRRDIAGFVRRLEKAGVLGPLAKGYKLLVRQSSTPRLRCDGSRIESQPARRCMWNYMRGPMARNGFCARDLVHWSQTDETRITPGLANGYISRLLEAGYLILLSPAKRGSPAWYRLDPKMIKGPDAPMILQSMFVFDPNIQDIQGDATAVEVMA